MIAIPVMRGRVAPVLNWCSRLLIFPAIPEGGSAGSLTPELEAVERLQLLQAKGVHTLICGALSADLDHFATKLGLRIIPGVAGEVDEVLRLTGKIIWTGPNSGCRDAGAPDVIARTWGRKIAWQRRRSRRARNHAKRNRR